MGFLDKLGKALQGGGSGGGGDGNILWLYVQCKHCGEVVRVRVNKSTDLEHLYDPESEASIGYALHKEVMGTKCFRLMRVEMRFDTNQRVVEQSVEGGQLLSREQAEAVQ